MSVYVIAELGSNHDGSVDKMLEGVQVAARCGANALKLQWTSDAVKLAHRRGKAYEDGYVHDYRLGLEWTKGWHLVLSDACRSENIDYMCTVYLPEDIEVVAPHVSKLKVSSFEAMDEAFVRAHLKHDKEVLVSTGMVDDWRALRDVRLKLLQCTSSYPAELEEMNLRVLHERHLRETENVFHGLSDHSAPTHVFMGGLATAAGAQYIERHIRLPKTFTTNKDYPHAQTETQFRQYVQWIRYAERALGDGVKKIEPGEKPMLAYRAVPS